MPYSMQSTISKESMTDHMSGLTDTPVVESTTRLIEKESDNEEEIKQEDKIDEFHHHHEQTNLFIGDLSKECTEEDLFREFSKYGHVLDVQIKRSKLNRNPLGYGFVRLSSQDEALMCMEALNETEICGRAIRVGWAQRNSRLHVTNLDASVTEEELNSVFAAYGEVVEADTVIYRTEGRYDAYAQIHYQKREQAEDAKGSLNGTYVKSRPIYLDWNQNALRRSSTSCSGEMQQAHNSHRLLRVGSFNTEYTVQESPVVSLHVRFEVLEKEIHINDTAFLNVFSRFGRVTQVAIKNNMIDPITNHETGYAFVHYESSVSGRDAAARAVEAIRGTKEFISDGVVYMAEFSHNFRRGVGEDTGTGTGTGTGAGSVPMTAGMHAVSSSHMETSHALGRAHSYPVPYYSHSLYAPTQSMYSYAPHSPHSVHAAHSQPPSLSPSPSLSHPPLYAGQSYDPGYPYIYSPSNYSSPAYSPYSPYMTSIPLPSPPSQMQYGMSVPYSMDNMYRVPGNYSSGVQGASPNTYIVRYPPSSVSTSAPPPSPTKPPSYSSLPLGCLSTQPGYSSDSSPPSHSSDSSPLPSTSHTGHLPPSYPSYPPGPPPLNSSQSPTSPRTQSYQPTHTHHTSQSGKSSAQSTLRILPGEGKRYTPTGGGVDFHPDTFN